MVLGVIRVSVTDENFFGFRVMGVEPQIQLVQIDSTPVKFKIQQRHKKMYGIAKGSQITDRACAKCLKK